MKWPLRILLCLAVLGSFLYMGVLNLRRAIINELQESAEAIQSLQQGYTIAGLTGASKNGDGKAKAAGEVVIPNEKVENLDFSEKTLKQLKAAGLDNVSDLLELRASKIALLLELDPETINEVTSKLDELRKAAAK